ncbi:hypothetical protein O181_048922 [Austropuccinia psidii MF-1]|uniref:PQ loop repeat protein n=1 Tax=Austropuccinia psidii MF-1 TaxID=1389203 RepID=A0A9Q3E0S9_9BASI|nr:hypothetical protein [Austropuccinia psidii MF-1]
MSVLNSNSIILIFNNYPSATSSSSCRFSHNPTNLYLSLFIIIGLLISYLPQHIRIISSRSSQGISPWFLLLGSTSTTSSLVNLLTLQWGVIKCCNQLSFLNCLESLLGIIQVFLQFLCFNLILILSLIYFPPDEKYVRVLPVEARDCNPSALELATNYSSQLLSKFLLKKRKTRSSSARRDQLHDNSKFSSSNQAVPSSSTSHPDLPSRSDSFSSIDSTITDSSDSSSFHPSDVLPPSATRFTPLTLSKEYTISLVLTFVVLIHFIFSAFITFFLLLLLPKATVGEPSGTPPSHSGQHPNVRLLRIWATCSGILSMLLAGCQYIPQIFTTYSLKRVGSLSTLMMSLQTPGSFLFAYSLAILPGVNWTAWIVYMVSGILQGILLIMCLIWKSRQESNGIDDWGRPLRLSETSENLAESEGVVIRDGTRFKSRSERSPLLGLNHQQRRK